jgi:class 3 adenylate cyclase
MDNDEEGTVVRFIPSQCLISSLVGDYGGSVVDTAGDGLVALFPSATLALDFAVEMQREMSNAAVWSGGQEPIAYRIGITIGDTIVGDSGVYGHGINMAARIQALASPGGICIAEPVHQFVRNEHDARSGRSKQKLKNIADEVEVLAVDFGRALPSPNCRRCRLPHSRILSRTARWLSCRSRTSRAIPQTFIFARALLRT